MLVACETCDRFTRDAVCPFCGTAQSKPVATKPTALRNVSRGALLVSGALAVAGCDDDATMIAAYGVSPFDAGVEDSGSIDAGAEDASATSDLGEAEDMSAPPADAEPDFSVAPAYGVSPPDMGASQDASNDDPDLSVAPLYGIPPFSPE